MYFKIKLLMYAIIHRQEQKINKKEAWNQMLRKKKDLQLKTDPIINENYTI